MAQYAKRSHEKRSTISIVVSPVVENYLRTVSRALDKSMSSVAAEILEAAVNSNRPTKKAS